MTPARAAPRMMTLAVGSLLLATSFVALAPFADAYEIRFGYECESTASPMNCSVWACEEHGDLPLGKCPEPDQVEQHGGDGPQDDDAEG